VIGVRRGRPATWISASSRLSGAFERETDFCTLCYDNEAYGNTACSGPEQPLVGARTTRPRRQSHSRKDIEQSRGRPTGPLLAPPAAPNPTDLFSKVRRPHLPGSRSSISGPLPHGVAVPRREDHRDGLKLAVKTGMWVPLRAGLRKARISAPSRRRMATPLPCADYLSPRGGSRGSRRIRSRN